MFTKQHHAIQLRPYQRSAVDQVGQRVLGGTRRLILVSPTGSGKTTVAGAIIASAVADNGRVLFLAHRRELINQAYRRLVELGIDEGNVGVLMANDPRRRPAAAVQVASIDTLRHRPKPHANIVFVDECHRSLAPSYREIAAHYSNAIHLGLTATPYRADGKGLGDAYDDLVMVATPRQLIAEGYLVEPRVFTVPASALPDLSSVRVKGGDYDEAALASAVDRQARVGNIGGHWLRHAQGTRTVVFAVSVAHSKHIVERFQQAGVRAEHLDGTTPTEQRDAILARLDSGETLVVSNCGVLCEGWDQPSVKCAILARPTKSTGLYLQQAGRILRPWQDLPAILLDHGGCAMEHGLPHDDRVFSLDTPNKRRRDAQTAAPLKTCPECFAVLPMATRSCPECGAQLFDSGMPEEAAGNLIEVTPQVIADARRVEWDRLCATVATRGYQPGWAYHRYRERFGAPPPPSFPKPKAEPAPPLRTSFGADGPRDAWEAIEQRIAIGRRT